MESICPDDANGGMKDAFRGIFRGIYARILPSFTELNVLGSLEQSLFNTRLLNIASRTLVGAPLMNWLDAPLMSFRCRNLLDWNGISSG